MIQSAQNRSEQLPVETIIASTTDEFPQTSEQTESDEQTGSEETGRTYLVRYGAIADVVFAQSVVDEELPRGSKVVVETDRGLEIAEILEVKKDSSEPGSRATTRCQIRRVAESSDLEQYENLKREAKQAYPAWEDRITQWNIDVQLIDLEWTLEKERLVLFVLNERGPDCTKLALQATAAGFGPIDVQPVSLEGLVHAPPKEKSGGGCGSGGGGCGCH